MDKELKELANLLKFNTVRPRIFTHYANIHTNYRVFIKQSMPESLKIAYPVEVDKFFDRMIKIPDGFCRMYLGRGCLEIQSCIKGWEYYDLIQIGVVQLIHDNWKNLTINLHEIVL